MISIENARKWTEEAVDYKLQKMLDKWVIKVGDDWVPAFKGRMSLAMLEAIADGEYEASVEIHSPKYKTDEKVDKWQEFICLDLEKLLQEYEALGFQDGASECEGAGEYGSYVDASYRVTVEWGLRKRRPGLQRIRYA